MSIISPTRAHAKPESPAERPRGIAPARLGGPAGVSREVLCDLNAAAKTDRQPLMPPPIHIDPMPELRASMAIELAVYMETNYVLDDISAVLSQLGNLIRPLVEAAPGEYHAERMLLTAYFAEETGTETAR